MILPRNPVPLKEDTMEPGPDLSRGRMLIRDMREQPLSRGQRLTRDTKDIVVKVGSFSTHKAVGFLCTDTESCRTEL